MVKETSNEIINAGRVLVVGTQGGGKTALVTKLAARENRKIEYIEEFGGTVETEVLRVGYDEGKFFGLMLPIGGQEKWSKLRSRFGSTAEGIVIVLDSCTKRFWSGSLRQAVSISTVLPYENYPIVFFVTKRDLNEVLHEECKNIAKLILDEIEIAKTDGMTYYSRGFRIIQRSFTIDPNEPIPFSKAEQIIVNALEKQYFSDLVPGDAKKGKMLLEGLSLVNARLFSRALALALSKSDAEDEKSLISLLNDMRPTMLELDSNWENLNKKYPKAGSEPMMPIDVSENDIVEAITKKLLANNDDISKFAVNVEEMAKLTGWRLVGNEHISIYDSHDLDIASALIRKLLESVKESTQSAKFTLFEPLEELF